MANETEPQVIPSPSISADQLDRWRGFAEEASKDTGYVAHHEKRDQQRIIVRSQMLATLQEYLAGLISPEQLRSVFQTKTMNDWDVFGLKGISGAMVLNQLVKQIPASDLDLPLRVVLAAPLDDTAAQELMTEFYRFVEAWRIAKGLNKLHIQTSNIPFFVSAWWHMQDPELWPIFYISGRQTLQREGLYTPTGNPVADYFAFRSRFRGMQTALSMTPWQFEHLCAWLDQGAAMIGAGAHASSGEQRPVTQTREIGPTLVSNLPLTIGHNGQIVTEVTITQTEEITHTQVQWMLAKIGKRLGMRVWIAENDRTRAYAGERLGPLSIESLPNVGLDPESQKTIRLIDVVWIKGHNQIVAAFEIEHTTSVFSGLLRMADLVAVYPNLSFPLYIVAPEYRMDLVRRQLRRPTFQRIELHQRCRFFSDESLFAEFDGIMKWATDPSIIDKQLAQRVGDVQQGDSADWLEDE